MNRKGKRRCTVFLALLPLMLLTLMLAGCATVGPDYVPPDPGAPNAWHNDLQGGLTAQQADPQSLSKWWATFDDPILSNLIEEAISGNLDLKAAEARIREARGNRRISRAGLFPTVDYSGSYNKSRSSGSRGIGSETDLYSTGFDAAWELDIFGGVRRSVEASEADLQASWEDLRDVLVTLLAEVALNYTDVRTFQYRLAVAEQNLRAQQETYELTQYRYQAGLTDELAVQQARYNLESTRSQIPSLRIGLEEAMNRVAVLLGKKPGAVHAVLEEKKPLPSVPLEVAVGVPAEALRRRPDVRRAERQFAAQTARIGVATADLYPKFRLFGSIGLESLSSGSLFSWTSRTHGFGPSFTWAAFDAGAIRGNIQVQSARQEEALTQYESTVLIALEEVENALKAYAEEQNRQESLRKSARAAKFAVQLAEQQYEAGLTDFSNVLDAQRSLLSFEDQLAQSEGTVVADLVRLYKAIGGGWTSLVPAQAKLDAQK